MEHEKFMQRISSYREIILGLELVLEFINYYLDNLDAAINQLKDSLDDNPELGHYEAICFLLGDLVNEDEDEPSKVDVVSRRLLENFLRDNCDEDSDLTANQFAQNLYNLKENFEMQLKRYKQKYDKLYYSKYSK